MEIKQDFVVNASCDRVWDILGNQYAQVSHWASSVYVSHPRQEANLMDSAPCTGRTCETALGRFTESITEYDQQHKKISYTAEGESMPFFVKGLANSWTVKPLENNKSNVSIRMEVSMLPVFSLLMGPILKRQMKVVLQATAEELTYFAENSKPHPRNLSTPSQEQLKAA